MVATNPQNCWGFGDRFVLEESNVIQCCPRVFVLDFTICENTKLPLLGGKEGGEAGGKIKFKSPRDVHELDDIEAPLKRLKLGNELLASAQPLGQPRLRQPDLAASFAQGGD